MIANEFKFCNLSLYFDYLHNNGLHRIVCMADSVSLEERRQELVKTHLLPTQRTCDDRSYWNPAAACGPGLHLRAALAGCARDSFGTTLHILVAICTFVSGD